jgi:Fe-S-cluster-containing dehydrogenase component
MLRPVLLLLKRSKSFGAYLQDLYCRRSLEALPSVPLLKNVPRSFLEELRTKLTLRQYEPGSVIFHEGDTADAFFLVQVGFVKVSRKLADGDLLVEYRGRHEFFGEIALLEKDASKRTRTATCTAADHVDLVRIENDDFQMLLDRFPDIRETVERAAAERRRTYENNPLARSRAFGKEEQVRQNLMEAQSLLLLDLDRCTRCDLCVKACEEAHDGTTRLVREGVRYDHYREGIGYEHYLVATSCRQCHDPLCMPGCPVGSIRRDKDLQIRIESWCIGCGVCAEKCPYGNINMHELRDVEPVDTRKAVAVPRYRAAACDLCHDVAHDPSCVIACPHGAAIRVEDPKSFFDNPVPPGTPARAPWR